MRDLECYRCEVDSSTHVPPLVDSSTQLVDVRIRPRPGWAPLADTYRFLGCMFGSTDKSLSGHPAMCSIVSNVHVGDYSSDSTGGSFLVRATFSGWKPRAAITVGFDPCTVQCGENVGGGQLQFAGGKHGATSCSFKLADTSAGQVLVFRIAAGSIHGCAELAGTAYCPGLAPHPPPNLPPSPPPSPPAAPPQPHVEQWLGDFLRAEPRMAEPRHWSDCPLLPRMTYDDRARLVRVHLEHWQTGTVILVHHGSALARPPGPCSMWLGTGSPIGDPDDDDRAILLSGTIVQHAKFLGQSRLPLAHGARPGGVLAFRLLDRHAGAEFVYKVPSPEDVIVNAHEAGAAACDNISPALDQARPNTLSTYPQPSTPPKRTPTQVRWRAATSARPRRCVPSLGALSFDPRRRRCPPHHRRPHFRPALLHHTHLALPLIPSSHLLVHRRLQPSRRRRRPPPLLV